jgi:hypothetical protein
VSHLPYVRFAAHVLYEDASCNTLLVSSVIIQLCKALSVQKTHTVPEPSSLTHLPIARLAAHVLDEHTSCNALLVSSASILLCTKLSIRSAHCA